VPKAQGDFGCADRKTLQGRQKSEHGNFFVFAGVIWWLKTSGRCE